MICGKLFIKLIVMVCFTLHLKNAPKEAFLRAPVPDELYKSLTLARDLSLCDFLFSSSGAGAVPGH